MQSTKCVTWASQELNQSISFHLGFFTLKSNFHILGVLEGPQHDRQPFHVRKSSSSFCNAFILLCTLTKLFTTYYISFIKYLATYTKFDVCTIATLKKLLALRSFNTTMGHLIRREVTLLHASSKGLHLPLEV